MSGVLEPKPGGQCGLACSGSWASPEAGMGQCTQKALSKYWEEGCGAPQHRVKDEGPTGLTRPPRRDLGRRFSVERLPAVVVLKPSGDVLTLDAADEIRRLGPACFANWQEAAEVLDRSFLLPEDLEDPAPRSLTEPLRRCKYRVDPAARGVRGRGRGGGPRQEGGAEGGAVGLF